MISRDQLKFIMKTFALDETSLAKTLGVAAFTVTRWMSGESSPSGLQEEVLNGLFNAAIQVAKKTHNEQKAIRGLVSLGIGALIFHLMTKVK